MNLRAALIATPIVATIGLVLALNALDANPNVSVAALGLLALISGGALGYFADEPPGL